MSFEVSVKKLVPKEIKVKLSNEQEKFCQLYTRDHDLMGDAISCFKECYELEPHQIDNKNQLKKDVELLLSKPQVVARINELIEEDGFNDQNVDRQHLFIINQHYDLSTKMKGIQEYNRLKKRTDNSLTLVLPRPIMDLDDDEVVQKIDKSKAKDITPPNINNG